LPIFDCRLCAFPKNSLSIGNWHLAIGNDVFSGQEGWFTPTLLGEDKLFWKIGGGKPPFPT